MIWLLFSLKGRVNRAYYWYGTILLIAAFFMIGYIAEEVLKRLVDLYSAKYAVWTAFGLVAWPIFAINVKRCHDFNKPWPLALLAFIPIVDVPYGFLMFLVKGADEPNRYGDDPCYRPYDFGKLEIMLEEEPWPVRHEELPEEILSRIRAVYSDLVQVYPGSMDGWIDGFKRDENPEMGIRLWEHMASVYIGFCDEHELSQAAKEEVYIVIVSCTFMNKAQILNQGRFQHISWDQTADIIERFYIVPEDSYE